MSESQSVNCFSHLRLHTEFSITDGLVTVKPLIDRLRELQMPSVALTDQNNMFGLIKFYSGAISKGVKPVCGCDLMVQDEDGAGLTQLVLLVKNQTGYLNLTNLISILYTENSGTSDASVTKSQLKPYTEGLIALSGGCNGDIGQALLAGDESAAQELLRDWMQYFPDSFYLELQRTGKAKEEAYIAAAVKLAISSNCPVVATNDVRFLYAEDFDAHEVRVCINERRTLDDPRRPHNYTEQQYLRSAQEMTELFADIPEAITNSVEIVKRCNLALDLGTPHLPNYPVPDGMKLEQYLSQLSSDGLRQRLKAGFDINADDFEEKSKAYWERLETELGIINQMGFAGYFLIVMEFIQWARDNDIPVGPGRGSGAGSIVAYALRITDLDPLKYDLLFERFLNPERVSMPDFDVDFCMEGRDRVIQHVADLYGKDAVSQIITFGTMAAKAVVRDVARVQGKSYGLADKLSKLIPFEPGMTLKKAFEVEPQLAEFVDADEDAQEIMEMAYKLEGITRNVGKHAGGVVIAPTKLTDFTPLYCDEKGQGLVTQFDKNDVETAGLVKFDFLGLRTLTIIDWAVKMIREQEHVAGGELDIEQLPLDDEDVYKLLQRGETTAVFQLESRGMKDLIKRLAPNRFEDIIALVALFRPGPLQSGMVDDYIDRKKGIKEVVYTHPELEPVLANTYGVILYQEQVMKIAQVLANYTLGGADILRKAMGKKNPLEMAKQRTLFLEGSGRRQIDADIAGSIFDLMEKFAGYGFNKSHSAAYALVSYQTAWLKVHYPAYFMAAVLSADMQNTDKIVTLIEECRSMDLTIIPPHVNLGQFNFTVNAEGEIVYGLGALKGLGEGPVDNIIAARKQGPFTSLLDFCQRVDSQSVNKRSMEALVKSGAFDRLCEGHTDQIRATLSASLREAMQAAEQSLRNEASGVADLFGEIMPEAELEPHKDFSGTTIRPWGEQQRLTAEKETLGLYLSGHPIDEYLPELAHITKERLANLRPEKSSQLVAGLLHTFRTMKSKAGDTIAFLVLDDRSARFEVSLFAKEYEKYRDYLHKDSILIVDCVVSVDDYNGGMRGRIKQIMNLAEARQKFAKRLRIILDASELAKGFCGTLTAILQTHLASAAQMGKVIRSATPVAATAANNSNKGRVNIALVVDNTANDPDRSVAATLAGSKSNDERSEESSDAALSGCPVLVEYKNSKAKGCIILGNDWAVTPSEALIQKLRAEYGKDNVALEYRTD